jgi:flagella basal body P-ring formation protein FlgA
MRLLFLTLTLFVTAARGEVFVPAADAVTVELVGEARVTGKSVTLRQIARLAEPDGAIGRIEVMTLDDRKYHEITAAEVADALRSAGISPAGVRVVGARRVAISRLDAAYDEAAELADWHAAPPPAAARRQVTPAAEVTTLRDRIIEFSAERLGISIDRVRVEFTADERLLRLPEGPVAFDIQPSGGRKLGRCGWVVTIEKNGQGERHTVAGHVYQMSQAAVLTRNLTAGEPLATGDIEWQPVELDRTPSVPFATEADIVGAAASRALTAGTPLSRRMLRPMPLVRRGQFVSVLITEGGVTVKAVARSLEDATAGQAVRLRDEATRSTYTAIVTGPQQAKLGG